MIKTALIFAAGRGERMMPYTQHTPKPLLYIQTKPLLAYHLYHLAEVGIQQVIINHAYLGSQIRQYVGNGQAFGLQVEYLPEPPGGLETAGTLSFISKAKHINEDILLSINADIFTNYRANPFLKLDKDIDAHLVLIPKQKHLPPANFGLSLKDNRVLTSPKTFIFSGISYYRMKALEKLSIGRYSIRDWLYFKAQQQRLSGEVFSGSWYDVGHPQIFQQLNRPQV